MKRIIATSVVCAVLLSAPAVFASDKAGEGAKAEPAKTEVAPVVKKTAEPASVTLKGAPETKPLDMKATPSKDVKAVDAKSATTKTDKILDLKTDPVKADKALEVKTEKTIGAKAQLPTAEKAADAKSVKAFDEKAVKNADVKAPSTAHQAKAPAVKSEAPKSTVN